MIGVLGCGNMASAIVTGIYSQFREEKFLTYTPSFIRAEELALKVNGKATKNLADFNQCEILIIGCKPQQFSELARNLQGEVDLTNKMIISIMAAVSSSSIAEKLGSVSITRVMPNTPSFVNEGVSLIYHAPQVEESLQRKAEAYFAACSQIHVLATEELFDKVTVVTGSGPAYVYFFAKTLVDNLINWGVPSQEARAMVTKLFQGSTALMKDRQDKSLGELIDEVTSKGGVTIEAINTFQEENLPSISEKALNAAWKKSQELTSMF